MENYLSVKQWASGLSADSAAKEIEFIRLKYTWLRCEESFDFIKKMSEDLPKILNIIKMQEAQNAMLRKENHKLRKYIEVNEMADECIIDDLRKKFNIDI